MYIKINNTKRKNIAKDFINDGYGGVTITSLAKKYDICEATVRKAIKSEGVNTKLWNGKKIYYNRKKIIKDSRDKFAFVGIMISDGNICGNQITITLKSDDGKYLENIKDFLEWQGEIKYKRYNRYDRATFRIRDTWLKEKLSFYGIVENKSLSVNPANIPDKYAWDLMCGIYDGDGGIGRSIRKGKTVGWYMEVCGSQNTICYIKKYWERALGHTVDVSSLGNIYRIRLSSAKEIYIVLSNLYKGNKSIILSRKYDLYKELKKWVQDREKICRALECNNVPRNNRGGYCFGHYIKRLRDIKHGN